MRDFGSLPLLLKQLALPTMQVLWEELATKAMDQGWHPAYFLKMLCEHELADRHRRRLVRHMRESCLPSCKSIESFDFAVVPTLNKTRIMGLASGDVWIENGHNLLIFGPSGVGKTHLAAGIGEKLIEVGYRVLFIRTTELVQKLQAAKSDLTLPAALDKLDKYHCLILDDFGYVKKNGPETSLLFELISERYERRSIVITCNQPFQQWDQIFEDKHMAIAAVDRLIHHGTVLELSAESYRKREAEARLQKEAKRKKG
jgi:DNA replication protein DnaC